MPSSRSHDLVRRRGAGGGAPLARALALLLLAACPAAAQKPQVETLSVGDGLPRLAISHLAQDFTGRLWILTQAGVTVYDGRAFETFSGESGLPAEELGALEIDAAGGVWTVTRWTGPRVYRLDGGRWRPLPAPDSGPEACDLGSIAVLPASGTVAVGSARRGLWLWDGAAWSHLDADAGLPAVDVLALATFDGAMTVGTGAGLCAIADRELDCRLRDGEPRLAEPILGLRPLDESPAPRLWILAATWLGYLEDDRLRVVADDLDLPGTEPFGRGAVLVDPVGGVYFGVEQQLFFLGPERAGVDRLGLRQGMATEGATSLLLDRESNVWVGSLRGLSKIESRRFLTFDRDAGLLEDEVAAVVEQSPGRLIFGHNLGLSILDHGEVETLHFERTPATAIEAYRVIDLALDRDGATWVAAHRMGLLRLGADGTLDTRYSREPIFSVEVDSEGRLWACGAEHLLVGDGLTFSPVDHGFGEIDDLRWLAAERGASSTCRPTGVSCGPTARPGGWPGGRRPKATSFTVCSPPPRATSGSAPAPGSTG